MGVVSVVVLIGERGLYGRTRGMPSGKVAMPNPWLLPDAP